VMIVVRPVEASACAERYDNANVDLNWALASAAEHIPTATIAVGTRRMANHRFPRSAGALDRIRMR
jgi:hypothetical protein